MQHLKQSVKHSGTIKFCTLFYDVRGISRVRRIEINSSVHSYDLPERKACVPK
jgi:hypothetical protein